MLTANLIEAFEELEVLSEKSLGIQEDVALKIVSVRSVSV
jgi:hypothetical protein